MLIPKKVIPVLKFKSPALGPYGDYESIVGGPMKISEKIINFD